MGQLPFNADEEESAAELANLPVEQLNKYEKDMITELDRELQKEFAYDQGREEGREEGRKEGREEARRELLEKLQSLGVSPDVIAKL